MSRKGQALIITLWVLLILAILAVSLGHRVSLALRLSRYQSQKLKAHYLANAGLSLALREVINDARRVDALQNIDTLEDNWAKNDELFAKIKLDNNSGDFAQVGYVIVGPDKIKQLKFGVMDEERKININSAPEGVLVALLNRYEVARAQEVARNIRIWRGDSDIPDSEKMIYEDLGYPCKSAKFTNIEELKLVKGIDSDLYEKIKHLITAYPMFGDFKININTVSLEVLTVIAQGMASQDEKAVVNALAEAIMASRDSKGCFKEKADITPIFSGSPSGNIFTKLLGLFIFKSDNFLIEVNANAGRIKSRISCVYSRKDKKTIYWYEG